MNVKLIGYLQFLIWYLLISYLVTHLFPVNNFNWVLIYSYAYCYPLFKK